MADAVGKVTVFFKAVQGDTPIGWTETFYSAIGDSISTLQLLVTNVRNNYVPNRALLLGLGASIFAIRATQVSTSRISWVYFLTGSEGQPTQYTRPGVDNFDPAQGDLLMRMMSSVGKRRQFWLGGVPDSQTVTGLPAGVTASYKTAAEALILGAVSKAQLAMRFKIGVNEFQGDIIQYVISEDMRKRDRGRPFRLFRGRRLA